MKQRNSIDCRVNKCLNDVNVTKDLDSVNTCSALCYKPLEFQQKYAIDQYQVFQDDL